MVSFFRICCFTFQLKTSLVGYMTGQGRSTGDVCVCVCVCGGGVLYLGLYICASVFCGACCVHLNKNTTKYNCVVI